MSEGVVAGGYPSVGGMGEMYFLSVGSGKPEPQEQSSQNKFHNDCVDRGRINAIKLLIFLFVCSIQIKGVRIYPPCKESLLATSAPNLRVSLACTITAQKPLHPKNTPKNPSNPRPQPKEFSIMVHPPYNHRTTPVQSPNFHLATPSPHTYLYPNIKPMSP